MKSGENRIRCEDVRIAHFHTFSIKNSRFLPSKNLLRNHGIFAQCHPNDPIVGDKQHTPDNRPRSKRYRWKEQVLRSREKLVSTLSQTPNSGILHKLIITPGEKGKWISVPYDPRERATIL